MTRPKGDTVTIQKSAWQRWPGQSLRWALGIIPLIWLFQRTEPLSVLSHIADIHVGWWIAAIIATSLSIAAGTLRWGLLLRAYGELPRLSFSTLFLHNLIGIYFSLLPSGLAGDAVRGYRVRKAVPDLATSYAIVIFEKLTALLGLVLVTLACALARPRSVNAPALHALDPLLVLAALTLLAVLIVPNLLATRPGWQAQALRVPVLGNLLVRLCPIAKPRLMLVAVTLSCLASALAVVTMACLCHPLAPDTPIAAICSVAPLIILLTYVPITPAAIGQREAVVVYTLGFIGIPQAESLAISVLSFSVGITFAAAGALCYFGERLAIRGTTSKDE